MPIPAGQRDKLIDIEIPDGEPIPDGDGGFDQPYKTLRAGVYASIEPATARGLERFRSNTVISTASHVLGLPWIAGVTTEARVIYGGRILQVRGFQDPFENQVDLFLACEEIVK